MKSGKNIPVVITAAGNGTRFRPFTSTIPKELLPIGGIPAIEHVTKEVLNTHCTEVYIVIHPNDTLIAKHLQAVGINNIKYMKEDLALGYGNAAPLLTLENYLTQCEYFGVAFGDDVLLGGNDFDLMLSALRDDVEAVIAGTTDIEKESRSFGMLSTYAHDPMRVKEIKQNSQPGSLKDGYLLISRVVVRPSIFNYLHRDWGASEIDLGIALNYLAQEKRVIIHQAQAKWVTVGDPEHYLQAQLSYREWKNAP